MARSRSYLSFFFSFFCYFVYSKDFSLLQMDLLVLQLNQSDSDLSRLDRRCFDFSDQDFDRGFGHFFRYIVFIMNS